MLPEETLDRAVGGERILISMAVPRRIGTKGVSSRATKGRPDGRVDSGADPLPWLHGLEWLEPSSNASIKPGETMI